MEGTFVCRTVTGPIRFLDRPSGASFEGRLHEVKFFMPFTGARRVELVAWFDYWVFKQIDGRHAFGYTFESIDREGLSSWLLTSARPMQLVLRLNSAMASSLGSDPEAALDALLAGLESGDSPLRDQAAWRYLGVYQQRAAGGATILHGFTSTYSKKETE